MSKKRTHHSVYRKIYKQHYGSIPKDDDGRSYEIHHIDGDHTNNDPSNLKAVTLQEHYDIHYAQGDWSACLMMSERMKTSPEEKSRLASLHCHKMISQGRNALMNRDQSGANSPTYDHTIYCFEHKDTKERVYMTRYEFYTKYNIAAHQLTGLIHGSHHSVHRWVLIKVDDEDNEISSERRAMHRFRNERTGEEVLMTQADFVRKYNLNKGNVNNVIKKRVRMVKGWTLVQ
jgi:hypothetical protein